MAISYVNSASGGQGNIGSPTLTVSFDAGTASNRVLFVLGATDRGGSITIDSCTYGGQAMTAEPGFTSTVSFYDGRLFSLINPPTGVNDIILTTSSGATGTRVNAIVYSGVNQTTPYENYEVVAVAGTSPNFTITSAVDDLALWITMARPNSTGGFTPGNGSMVERIDQVAYSGSATWVLTCDRAGEASPVTMEGTFASSNERWGAKLSVKNDSAAAGVPKTSKLTLLGVG